MTCVSAPSQKGQRIGVEQSEGAYRFSGAGVLSVG
jgi:hypothetical protein